MKLLIKVNILFLLIIFLIIILYFKKDQSPIYFEKYQTNIFNEIKEKLKKAKCSIMWGNQREFINGIIRKFKPKKLVEIGVYSGGSSIIILNAIKDIEKSKLFSIEIKDLDWIGKCVYKNFPNLLNKWKLFKGGIAVNYIEKIGQKIDLAMIDSSHFEPGEILDFLMILPFLKEEAIIIFHDIDHQITSSYGKNMRNEWAPYIIFNLIRGEKYLPSGKGILNKDIGAIKLEKNQKRFIHDYCRALGGQWQYFPSEKNIKDIIKYFEKYYDKDCQIILKESIEFNRQFLKDNPKEDFYGRKKDKNLHKKIFYFNNIFKGQYISNNSFNVSSYYNTTRENKEEIDIQNYINLAFNNILLEKNNTFNCSDNPKISIVITVYNGEAYLNTALRSIQNQDLKDIEIIMVDDYSSDNSLNMINNLMINEPRIKLYKNEKNRGALYTKTKGALLAKGKYILILDEDDMYLQRDAFTVLYNEAEKNNLDLIKFGMIISKPLIGKKNYINYINKEEIIFQPELSSLMFRYNEKGDVKIFKDY